MKVCSLYEGQGHRGPRGPGPPGSLKFSLLTPFLPPVHLVHPDGPELRSLSKPFEPLKPSEAFMVRTLWQCG